MTERLSPAICITTAGRTDERGAARFLGTSTRTLRRWRRQDDGPAYHLIGRRVWYAIDDLNAYLQQGRRDPLAA